MSRSASATKPSATTAAAFSAFRSAFTASVPVFRVPISASRAFALRM
ncbi:hypothetical protein [Streptomyces avidinii]